MLLLQNANSNHGGYHLSDSVELTNKYELYNITK